MISVFQTTNEQTLGLISEFDLPIVDRVRVEDFTRASCMCFVAKSGQTVLCIWGLIAPSFVTPKAYIWVHSRREVSRVSIGFARKSLEVTRKMLEVFPEIVGHCESKSKGSIRWLRWCGAEFGSPTGPLVPFTLRASHG